jgi:hypothetical protein
MKYSLLFLLLFATSAQGKNWQVGPTRQYTVPSAVMNLVADGDTVLIDPSAYTGDVGVWNNNNLVIRCPNGMARFNANGNIAQHKGIWVLAGNNTYVEGFEFYGAAVDSTDGDNGAGIRVGGNGLTCRRCYFHDNQEGILTGNNTTNNSIWIEACEFDHNGVETGGAAGYEHNIYVGHSTSCTIKFCYFHASIVGHEIKTRANVNYILYNKIVDGPTGDGSYSIDMPNGGLSFVIGNSIEKGPMASNSTVISYGEEGIVNPDSEFYFVNNTVVTDRNPTTFLNIQPGTNPALIANNIFAGTGHPLTEPDTMANVESTDTSFFHFADPGNYDYHIRQNFPGFLSAATLGSVDGFSLAPMSEYVDPEDSASIPNLNEIGAFPIYLSSEKVVVIKNFQSVSCSGESDTAAIVVTNTGNSQIACHGTLSGPNSSDFSLVLPEPVLQPAGVDTFLVIFTPSTDGVETDTLFIHGGAGDTIIPLQTTGGAAIIAGTAAAPSTAVGKTSAPFVLLICNTGTCPCTPGIPTVDPQFAYLSGGTTPIEPGDCKQIWFTYTPNNAGTNTYPVIFPNFEGSASSTNVTITTASDGVRQSVANNELTEQNYPNPFDQTTQIVLPSEFVGLQVATLNLYDVTGALVLHKDYPNATSSIEFSREDLASGVYYYRIVSQDGKLGCSGSVVISP